MTDQKPTGVFVRLPVTDDQAQEMYRAYCAAYASSSLTTRGTATQAALLAIGTPVQADGLKTFLRAIVSGKSLVGMLEPDSRREMPDVFEDIPLVRQFEAQAQIAARDAEIVRLREIPALFSEYEKLMDSGEDVASMMVYAELKKRVHKSLKGDAA